MRDRESRGRKALEEMPGRAELSSAVVWCYPGVIPIPGMLIPKHRSRSRNLGDQRGPEERDDSWGGLETYGGGGEFKALLGVQLLSERKQGRGEDKGHPR